MAITWRNVDSGSLGDPNRSMAMAMASFNAALDGAKGIVTSIEETDSKNWDVTKQNNTQEQLNWLSQFKTPEEAQAAMAAGEFQRRMAGMGAQVDQQAVRQAVQSLVPDLQRRASLNQQYVDQRAEVGERDAVGKIKELIAAGRYKDAAAGIGSAGVRATTAAALQSELQQAQRAATLFEFQKQDQARQGAEFAMRRRESDARIANLNAEREAGPKFQAKLLADLKDKETGAALQSIQQRLQQNLFAGRSVKDTNAQLGIAKLLKETGVRATDASTRPENFLANLKALQRRVDTKKNPGDKWLSDTGDEVFIEIDDPNKPGKKTTVQVPLPESVIMDAINEANGWIQDPSLSDVNARIKEKLRSPQVAQAALDFLALKDQAAALNLDAAQFKESLRAQIDPREKKN